MGGGLSGENSYITQVLHGWGGGGGGLKIRYFAWRNIEMVPYSKFIKDFLLIVNLLNFFQSIEFWWKIKKILQNQRKTAVFRLFSNQTEGYKKRGRRRRTFFFHPFSSFSTQFPRLRSAFGLASLGKTEWKAKIQLHSLQFVSLTFFLQKNWPLPG